MRLIWGLAVLVALANAAPKAPDTFSDVFKCPCENGGRCMPDTSCECSPNHVGIHCEKYCNHETEDAECVCHNCNYGDVVLENPATGYISHPTYCNIFYQCVRMPDGRGGVTYSKAELMCPPGLHFSPLHKTCDWPRNVDCHGTDKTGPLPPQPTYKPDLSCFGNGLPYRRHPSNCFTFQKCVHGNTVDMCCYPNLVFNESTNSCEQPLDYDRCTCEDLTPCQAGPDVPGICDSDDIECCYLFNKKHRTLQDLSIKRAETVQADGSSVVVQPRKNGRRWGAWFNGRSDILQNFLFSGAYVWNQPDEFTIYVVFTADGDGPENQGLVSNGDCHYAASFGVLLLRREGKQYVEGFINDRDGGSIRIPKRIRPGKKYGVTLTYCAARGSLEMYMGYERYARSGVYIGPVKNSHSPMFLGFDGCLDGLTFFKGQLHQVRIWRKVFTDHLTYTGP